MSSSVLPVGDLPTVADGQHARRPASRGRLVLRRLVRTRRAQIGGIVLIVMLTLAYIGPLVCPYTIGYLDYDALLVGPGTRHWFGTDNVGHDLFARTAHGLQKSLLIGALAGPLGTIIAGIVGSTAGYFGGWVDRSLRKLGELFLVLPAFYFYLMISARIYGGSFLWVVLLLAGFSWMIMAQLVRNMTVTLRQREFVRAARYMGAPAHHVIRRHILPNVASLLIIDATLGVGGAIVAEAGLSFFGFGVRPPDISLGTLLSMGQTAATTYWWEFVFPAAALVLTVFSTSLIGDALRDAIDPTAVTAGR